MIARIIETRHCNDCRHCVHKPPNRYCKHPELTDLYDDERYYLSIEGARQTKACGPKGNLFEAIECLIPDVGYFTL